MAADQPNLGYSHFLWADNFITYFQMKFKFSKKIQTVYDFIHNFFFVIGLLSFTSKSLYAE